MLYTYTNSTQSVATDAAIALNTNAVQTGCTVTHTAGTTAVSLNKTGYYEVHFNADVTSATTGALSIQMQGNGVDVAGAEATTTVTTASEISNVSFTAIVRVLPNCCAILGNIPYVLTFVNTGAATASVSNAAVTVTKVA